MSLRRSLAVSVFSILLGACGATHHFVPSRPQPKGDIEFSAALISFDINRCSLPTIFTEFNLWWGVGNDYNLGVGIGFLTLNHLSAAKYYRAQGNDLWATYFHVNNLFAENASPQLETGGIYIAHSAGWCQSFSAGMGYGYRKRAAEVSRSPLPRAQASYLFGDVHRLFPSIKYVAAGSEWGLSYMHYFGMTRVLLAPLIPSNSNRSDTGAVFVLRRDSVRSLPTLESGVDAIDIELLSGDVLSFKQTRWSIAEAEDMFRPPADNWLMWNDFVSPVNVSRNGEHLFAARIDLKELCVRLRESDSLLIVPYDTDLAQSLSRVTTWKSDHSFGLIKIRPE